MINLIKFFTFYLNIIGIRIAPILLLSVASAFLDLFGILLVLPVLMGRDEGTFVARILGEPIYNFVFTLPSLLQILLLILLFFGKAIFQYLNSLFQIRVRLKIFLENQIKLISFLEIISYDKYQALSIPKIQELHLKHIANTCEALALLSSLISYVFMAIILSYPLVSFNVYVLFGASIFIALGGFIFYVLSRKTSILSRRDVYLETEFAKIISRSLGSFKYLFISGLVSRASNDLKESVTLVSENKFRIGVFGALATALREPFILVAILSLYVLDVLWMGNAVDDFFVALFLLYRVFSFSMTVGNSFVELSKFSGSVSEVQRSIEDVERNYDEPQVFSDLRIDTNLGISLRDITFSYPASDYQLKVKNIEIGRSGFYLIRGHSGSGKTTLVDIMTGLLPALSGEASIGGVNPLHLSAMQRHRLIGYLAQGTQLLDTTLLNNIVLWEPVDIKKVFKVLNQVGLKEFANFESVSQSVGIDGSRFSGGQRQRILIARELYRDIPIIIFDEPTSALDKLSERRIFNLLRKISFDRSIIVISHSTEAAKYADQVFLVNDGTVNAQ